MSKIILITGASGLIGKPLVNELLKRGYCIHQLTTRIKSKDKPMHKFFLWDVYRRKIDEKCIEGAEILIHLAGEGIADKRWTKERKKQILESRTESIRMIYGLLRRTPDQKVKTLISASAVGYYSDRGDGLMTEEKPPANDFLGKVCIEWEKAADEAKEFGMRVVKLRTGVVLDDKGGALNQIAKPVKLGLGTSLGSGKQWMSWIHIHDTIKMYLFALDGGLEGSFNMAAPHPVTNKELTIAIAKQLNKPLWLPNVPAFALKLALGEMSEVVLGSTKASANKIRARGFEFDYPTIESALKEIYPSPTHSKNSTEEQI